MAELILASGSPIRARLLSDAGVSFVQEAANDAVETALKETFRSAAAPPPRRQAVQLSVAKANAVALRHPGAAVIGADQVLVKDGEVFEKPGSLEKLRVQLKDLRGGDHVLETAVVIVRDEETVWSHVASPRLTMRRFSDAFLEDYLNRAAESVGSCVGGYQIEGLGAQLFDAMEGDIFAVQGLPLIPLLNALRRLGLIEA